MINKKIVIPHEFSKSTQPGSSLRFFSRRSIVIQLGQSIEFKNNDDNSHYLESVNLQGKLIAFSQRVKSSLDSM